MFGSLHPFFDDTTNLFVNNTSGSIRVCLCLRHIATEEYFVIALSIFQWSKFVRHTPIAYHFACYISSAFDVVTGTGGDTIENNFFSRATAKCIRNNRLKIFA